MARIKVIHGSRFLVELERDKLILNLRQKEKFEREIYFTKASSFNWSELLIENEDSLFPSSKIIDLRIENSPIKADSEFLIDLCKGIPAEKYLIISISGIERLKTRAWFKAVLNHSDEIEVQKVWPNKRKEWIRNAAKDLSVNLSSNSLEIINEKTQGNLLAAYQELKMMKVLNSDSEESFVEDSSEFDIFNLSNSLLLGNINQSLGILKNLKLQKGSEALIVWGIFRELERLSFLKEDSQTKLNGPFDYIENLRKKSKAIPVSVIHNLKTRTANLDTNFKKGEGNFWSDLERVVIDFCQTEFHS